MKNKEITVLDQAIHINKDDYFSLTDIARYKNPEEPRFVIQNWMRRIDTIQYLGLWEQLNNPNFNRVEFDTFRSEAGHNYFTMTPKKWIEGVNAIGIVSKAGKYNSGTYAHKDIALQFASWISPEINLYIIKEFQRLKAEEQKQLDWSVKRSLPRSIIGYIRMRSKTTSSFRVKYPKSRRHLFMRAKPTCSTLHCLG